MQVKAKNVVVSAIVVLLVGALWFRVVYSPMASKTSKAKSAAHDADVSAANLRHSITAAQEAQKRAKSHEVAADVMLRALPVDAAEASFLRGVDALRISSGANWQSITPSTPTLAGGVTSINVAISVQGTEEQLMRYVNGLYALKRIFVLDNLSITQNGSGGAPGSTPHATPGAVFSGEQMQMQVSGRIFSQPGAVPAPPAGATTPAAAAPAPAGA